MPRHLDIQPWHMQLLGEQGQYQNMTKSSISKHDPTKLVTRLGFIDVLLLSLGITTIVCLSVSPIQWQ
jgi:hypothetical protein